jgi:hypothetical protein
MEASVEIFMNKMTYRLIALACSLLLLACAVKAAAPVAVEATPAPVLTAPAPPTATAPATPGGLPAATPTQPAAPAPTATPPSTSPPAGPPQEIQACSLLTAAEAEAILGEPAGPPQEINGACAYSNAKDGLYMVSAAAAQGPQADGILQGQAFLLGMAGASLDEAKLAGLKALAGAGDFAGFFAELAALAGSAPAAKVELIQGLGDVGYWAWLDAQSRRQGALVVGRGGTLVNVNVVVADTQAEQAMLDACKGLAESIFGRLPASFSLALPPTPTHTPTPPPPTDTPTPLPSPTFTPTPFDPNAPPAGFFEQPSYTGDCMARPAGSICLGFDDGYIWFLSPFNDGVQAWGEAGFWRDKKIQVVFGQNADYHHILGTNLVKKVSK